MYVLSTRQLQWGGCFIFFISGLLFGKLVYSPDKAPEAIADNYVAPTDSEIRDDVNSLFVKLNTYDPSTLRSEKRVQPISLVDQYTTLFIETIVQIESHGKPRMVGGAGEREGRGAGVR